MNNIDTKTPFISNIKMNKEFNSKLNSTIISKNDEKFDIEKSPYIEDPWTIIEAYFRDQHLDRLVRHQLESYNNFVGYQLIKTIEMFNPVHIKSENDFDAKSGKYALEIVITFENFHIYRPQIHENNGAIKLMFPQEARLRNFTYSSAMTIDINIKYIIKDGENLENVKTMYKTLPKIHIGKLPIMLKSSICVLNQYKYVNNRHTGECKYDAGGYFIINGSEKTVLGQERAAENRVYCYNISKNETKYTWKAEIKSVPDFKCISPKQINMFISSKNNGFGLPICLQIPRVKQPIPLFIVFRALNILTDKEICEYILLNISLDKYKPMLENLQASIIEANKYMTYEDAVKYITGFVSYTPINMDKETGALKKHQFALEVLQNDLFPHCQTLKQKIYFLGYMANKLMQVSFDWIKGDDRDSYLNKRIDLTGTSLNNLFRNYFNKLVKDMEKQVVKEINNGSWRSNEDYLNIVNLTNIYKIIKSNTIENGFKRALSTGDFGIKHTNSNKVGVAQVLNRLTYVAGLSHLRRISTPTDKSGKLVPPRKLHNTSWGFLCPAETPEGASVGIVKNMAYMAHITIHSNSTSLYEYAEPHIIGLDKLKPFDLYNKVKVFINGSWIGISEDPEKLYTLLKSMKYKGIINIYTSIIFDYRLQEIRMCNDSGRITRPLLRVKDNNILITKKIMDDLKDNKLSWDDLLTTCKLDESIIEYVDPEEQSFSMIATKPKTIIETNDGSHSYRFTHCEIHPSTIFGVVASCIPYPDHNQSPRNTYQCLDIDETVLLSNGSKTMIKDIKLGDEVVCFNPLHPSQLSTTVVIDWFIINNKSPVYEIELQSGIKLTATDDHKLMTLNGWCQIKNMIPNITQIARLDNNKVIYDILNYILPVSDRYVCDITVESENHSFITSGGILSSNCAQAKQAMGVYATNFNERMDKTAYVLSYPTRPLVDTRVMNIIKLHENPSGCNINVAIMTHTGYNQEDSLLVNKGSIDRGLLQITISHTEKDEDKQKINGDEEIRCKPDPAKTKGMKFGNYNKVNSKGLVPENTLIENRDIIISKITPIKENRNDHTKVIKYEDGSRQYKTVEETYIDKNYIDRNGDGYSFAKVRLRSLRKPVIGDKFCALPTQQVLTDKGWIEIQYVDITLHKVATLDINGHLCYEHPCAKYEYEHNDKMVSIKNKQVEIVCTLNHRLYVKTRYGKNYELMEAQDVMGKMVRFKKSMENTFADVEYIQLDNDVQYKMDDWLPLLGMFIADGYCHNNTVYITALKERKINYNTQLLENLNINYTYSNDGKFIIYGTKYPELANALSVLSVGALNKYLPDYVWTLSQSQSRLLLSCLNYLLHIFNNRNKLFYYKTETQYTRCFLIRLNYLWRL